MAMQGFPRPVLWTVAAMLGLAVGAAALSRIHPVTDVPVSTVAAARNLLFADVPGGDVAVTDADTHVLVQRITGQAGFLRGVLRGLASQRLRAGLSPAAPFRLTAWRDGRLTLDDPLDARHIELEAFGPANEAVFAALLQPQGQPR